MTREKEREAKRRRKEGGRHSPSPSPPSPSPTSPSPSPAAAAVDGVDPRRGGEGKLVNRYQGWSPSESKDLKVPVLRLQETDWESLFSGYVSQRRPVVIQGSLGEVESSWKVDTRWSIPYLKESAGEAELSVEHRTGAETSFGKGNKLRMTFQEFLSNIEAGSENYYMTSQDGGEEKLFTSPLSELYRKGDFPLKPELLSGLVPSRINMWMGSSSAASGSSSGLHHDYHDNLYVLVKGNKVFELYSPKYAASMRTYGEAALVHSNGLINYEGYETNADGTTAHERRVRELKQKVKEAEGKLHLLEQGQDCDKEKLEAAERGLEEALELELELSMLGEGEDHEGTPEPEEEEEEQEETMVNATNRIATIMGGGHPPNFSSLTEEERVQAREKCLALTVHLSAGQMLYLPCGWFHNVTSKNAAPHTHHLAFNYWFYPPDNLGKDPNAPYALSPPLSPEIG